MHAFLQPYLAQNRSRFGSKMEATLAQKWKHIWRKNRSRFSSKIETDLAQKWKQI